jgi:sedoheptulokinase
VRLTFHGIYQIKEIVMYYTGIDIGTSSVCAATYNPESKAVETVNKENTANIEMPFAYQKIQNPEMIMETVAGIIGNLTTGRPGGLKGIGITGQMHGILYVDGNGDAVSPLYTWQDGRGNQPFKEGQIYAEYLSEKTGYPLSTGYGIVTHFYNRQNNLVPRNAVKLCTIMDYVAMKLSGRKSPLTDYSNGASLGCFDLKRLCFDTEALEKAGIDISILPNTVESGALAGYYNEHIPVYAAIGDNQATFLGSVQDKVRLSIHLSVGTSSQISVYSSQYVKIETVDTRPFPGGGYLLVGAALCGGKSFDILKTFFGETLSFLGGGHLSADDLFKIMTSVGYDDVSGDPPVVETIFDGARFEPGKRGSISNISISNLTPKNLVIGFAKGVCRELYDFYRFIPEDIRKDKTILVGAGNGIKKNPLLRKALEEQFQYDLYLPQVREEAAFGACICAMVGSGYAGSFLDFKF